MKKIFLLISLVAFFESVQAQARIQKVEYQKAEREAILHELPFPQDVVTKAIQDTLEKMGYKGKESKGYMVYKGVKLSALGGEAYDLYFSVDRKSRKEKDVSQVTMLISKGFDEFITEKSHPAVLGNAQDYLNNIRSTVAAFDLRQQITEQEETVKKVEKKIAGLVEDAEDLQKKKKKLEKEIEGNIKDQADEQKELEKQRQILETLRTKG